MAAGQSALGAAASMRTGFPATRVAEEGMGSLEGGAHEEEGWLTPGRPVLMPAAAP